MANPNLTQADATNLTDSFEKVRRAAMEIADKLVRYQEHIGISGFDKDGVLVMYGERDGDDFITYSTKVRWELLFDYDTTMAAFEEAQRQMAADTLKQQEESRRLQYERLKKEFESA